MCMCDVAHRVAILFTLDLVFLNLFVLLMSDSECSGVLTVPSLPKGDPEQTESKPKGRGRGRGCGANAKAKAQGKRKTGRGRKGDESDAGSTKER